jgi:hypothetical protein
MKVYHGGYSLITHVDLKKSKPNKYFGRGFYITKIRSQAEFWAKRMGIEHHTKGVISEFEFNERAWEDDLYSIRRFDDYTEEWLDFVALNRDSSTTRKQHTYDIVEGPVADDKIANRINDYLSGEVTKAAFLNELKFHKPSHQICLCTLLSLQMLMLTDKKPINHIIHIGEPIMEALMLDRHIDEATAAELFYNSGTFAQLAETSSALYQQPWTEIYQLLLQELNETD